MSRTTHRFAGAILLGEWREVRIMYFMHVITPVSRDSSREWRVSFGHALSVGEEAGKVGNRHAERASGMTGQASGAPDRKHQGPALDGRLGRVCGVVGGAVGDLDSQHLAGYVRLVGTHRVE